MDFHLNFYRISIDFIPYFKLQKRGLISTKPAEDTWHVELTWSAELARIRYGSQGHVTEPHKPMPGVGGAQVA